jgi:hypothetical protein
MIGTGNSKYIKTVAIAARIAVVVILRTLILLLKLLIELI